MTSELKSPPRSRVGDSGPFASAPRRRHTGSMAYATIAAQGEPLVWLTGGALSICVIMIVGLLGLIVYQGVGTFWPKPLVVAHLSDGSRVMGEVARAETYQPSASELERLPAAAARRAQQEMETGGGLVRRQLYRVGNFELDSARFRWIDDFAIESTDEPNWGLVIERLENGRFYGEIDAVLIDGHPVTQSPSEAWAKFQELHPQVHARWRQQVSLTKYDEGAINDREARAKLDVTAARLDYGEDSPQFQEASRRLTDTSAEASAQRKRINQQIADLDKENARYVLRVKPTQAAAFDLPLETIVRAYPANQLSWFGKAGVYVSRWWQFLTDDPRDSNRSGGYFPAIWGTVAMTLIMSLLVAPLGVLAALYLREYAKAGPLTSTVRIAINNLAGVPSIVFGAFGLGFFCYGVGAFIDGGPSDPWPPASWYFTLAGLAVVAVIAFVAGIASAPQTGQTHGPWRRWLRPLSLALWLIATGLAVALIAKSPFFHGFFRASLVESDSTFGKGGLLWASLTLALLTAPVVIVATEEALSAVPNSMREGSYACGASKWQTIRRIVLPRALPGIMTGMILAMARGAGEVAPLMLVGVKKVAADLPIDSTFPYLHPDRAFMHLAYMIYDVGYQSPDSEAARPMLFTTTLLLIVIVAFLNLAAIYLRRRLRRKFVSAAF